MTLVNPPSNGWSSALPKEKLESAVERSGYPVQSDVALMLRQASFGVVEEWSFKDRFSGDLRTLDVLGMVEGQFTPGQRVRPDLRLLIECKRSQHALVFFEAMSNVFFGHGLHPVVGMRYSQVQVQTDDTSGT